MDREQTSDIYGGISSFTQKDAVNGMLRLSRWFYIQKCRLVACNYTSWQAEMCFVYALWVHGMWCSVGLFQCKLVNWSRFFWAVSGKVFWMHFLGDAMLFLNCLWSGPSDNLSERGSVAYSRILCGPCKMALYYWGVLDSATVTVFQGFTKTANFNWSCFAVSIACTDCFVLIWL